MESAGGGGREEGVRGAEIKQHLWVPASDRRAAL